MLSESAAMGWRKRKILHVSKLFHRMREWTAPSNLECRAYPHEISMRTTAANKKSRRSEHIFRNVKNNRNNTKALSGNPGFAALATANNDSNSRLYF
jgi:hypothetical protein